jgi:phosphoribosylformylglycinamidine (FGAM) synthase-like amidotransferase family enzyme
VETTNSSFTYAYQISDVVTYPVAHHEGNYTADTEILKALHGDDRVAYTYVNNPNGSVDDIAGILSDNRRVLGMMPHPERMIDPALGGIDGNTLFESIASALVSA